MSNRAVEARAAGNGVRGRTLWSLALMVASVCFVTLIVGPGGARAAKPDSAHYVRPGAGTPPPGVRATISAQQIKQETTGVNQRGGFGWQTVVASSLSIRWPTINDIPGWTAVYGDQFNTDTISGSWCFGYDYYWNGQSWTYYHQGWVLCEYLHKN